MSTTFEPPAAGFRDRSSARISRQRERRFLLYVYAGTLFVRLAVWTSLYLTDYVGYFAGDVQTYDFFGWQLSKIWAGESQYSEWIVSRVHSVGINGMFYWVAAGYTLLGRSLFLFTCIQIVIVSFIPVLSYWIAMNLFGSVRAARLTAIMTAFFPSMIVWSSLMLKDPLVIFLFCLTIFYTIKLQRHLSIRSLIPAVGALLLIFPMRGYVFYFAFVAVAGSYLMARFGARASLSGYLVRLTALLTISILIFSLGFDDIARQQINANLLERIQVSRQDMAVRADSGFDAGTDVSTPLAALNYLPRGIVYLLFSPFPWEGGGLRKMLALPEMLVWYALFPFCLIGMVYAARRHLRDCLIIFLFSLQLTVFYAVFQGNVGTAHRQRTQIFVFYFMFTSYGLSRFRLSPAPDSRTVPDHGGIQPARNA